MTPQRLKTLLAATYDRWSEHNAPRLGAALAYYSLLSVAPLVILLVGICALVFGHTTAERDVVNQSRNVLGNGGANILKTLIDNARHPGAGILASVIAAVTLLFGASGIFIELRDSLNTIWDVPPRPSKGWRGMVAQRLAAFAMVLGLGLLLIASLVLSTAFAIVQKFATNIVPMPEAILAEVLNVLISLAALAVLFALVFKFVPNAPLSWRDAGAGASITAVLFIIGKSLLALYLTTAAVGSPYGAAGSVVAFVVWVYYSAQIFFFGAVFTKVYTEQGGASRDTSRDSATLARGQSAGKS
ncbi:MAG: YihY/virulence factor BrkB family protein [Acidobacteriaceae bacterium]|nr:YihY/virulence factor BrkB family protein [Acidobacteriaceae bacterium]